MTKNTTQQQSTSIADKVLATIAQEDVTPRPVWHFMLRSVVVWAAGTLFFCISAFSFAMIFFTTTHTFFALRHLMRTEPFVQQFFEIFPYLWLFSLGVFVVAIAVAVRYTKRGYRFAVWQVISAVLVLSALAGWFLYNIGVAHAIEERFTRMGGIYKTIEQRQDRMLLDAEQGRIVGRVHRVLPEHVVVRNGRLKKQWRVAVEALETAERVLLEQGAHVYIEGSIDADGTVQAQSVRSLQKFKPRQQSRGCRPPGQPHRPGAPQRVCP